MREFCDKVAVITGAASGIGRGIAERCARERMRVVLSDIDEQSLFQTARELQDQGAEVLAVVTDVAKLGEIVNLAQKTLSAFGGVHMLCNNAGVVAGKWIWESTIADWEWVIGVNLWGVVHGLNVFVPIMLKQDVDCHIVNTASMEGLTAFSGNGIYRATKHAVVSLSETLYLELEQIRARIKVSLLCPGGVASRIGETRHTRPSPIPATPHTMAGPYDNELGQHFWQRVLEETIQPDEVAESVFSAIREERFYILTHPQYAFGIQRRIDDILQGHNPTNMLTLL